MALVAVLLASSPSPSLGSVPQSELWVQRYNGPGNGYDRADAVAVSPDGTKVFVTGYTRGSPTLDDWATAAYDASTGTGVWARRFNGPSNSYDEAVAIAVSPDGSKVFVTGYANGSSSGNDYLTIAYDASTGATVWKRTYNGPGNLTDVATCVAVSPDGSKVFVSGYSDGGVNNRSDYATLALAASTGTVLWLKRYNGPPSGDDQAHSVAVSPDGSRVFVTGFSAGVGTDDDYATAAYDATTGATSWARRYDGPDRFIDRALSVAVSHDGSAVFVTGYSIGTQFTEDVATLAYDVSSGAPRWVMRYNAGGDDFGSAVAPSPDGTKVFVTGYTLDGNGFDYITISYDQSTGSQLWLQRYNGPGNNDDFALSLGVSPDGAKVFVTGYSAGVGTGADYATVAYDAAGTQVWIDRYNGPGGGDDQAFALGVSSDGSKVFVTGASKGATSDSDYATVAYPA